MKKFLLAILFVLLVSEASAMTDNGNGTRSFTVGSGGDYTTIADLVWVHPVGVTAGDTLKPVVMSTIFNEDFVAGAPGTALLPITISIGAKSFSDGGFSYLRFINSISSGAAGDAFSITAGNNKIWNCTIYNSTGDGIELTEDAEVKNTIFEAIGGDDINENGGTATTETNFVDLDGNPLFISAGSDFRLQAGSPAINAGTDLCSTLTNAWDATGVQVCAGGVKTGPWLNGAEIGAYGFSNTAKGRMQMRMLMNAGRQ
jgi:hypothetical protein